MEHYDQVQRAYDELVADGSIKNVNPGPGQDQAISEQKAYMTRRAAYYLWLLDNNYGLLEKLTGTNVGGLSIDITLKKSGEFFDIATDVEVANGIRAVRPVNPGGSTDTSLIPRWILPTKEMAGLNGGGPPPPVDDDINRKLNQILLDINQLHSDMSEQHSELLTEISMMQNQLSQLTTLVTKPATIVFPRYRRSSIFDNNMVPQPDKTQTE